MSSLALSQAGTRILARGRLTISQAEELRRAFTGILGRPHKVSRRSLLCVLPFCLQEADQITELLEWIEELGGCPQNPCLLVADCRFPARELTPLLNLAQRSFATVDFVQTPHSLENERWPLGPNWMFETAVRHIAKAHKRAFWWNEPDCIPIGSGWLTEIEKDYWRAGRPFLGNIIQPTLDNPCEPHLTGCAVYPADAYRYMQPFFGGREAWDFASREVVLPHAAETALLHSEWGTLGQPPTFASAGELSRINPRAVVYHRNKDGRLVKLLRQRRAEAAS